MYELVKDLRFGYQDAGNYRQRDAKEFFNRVFLRDESLVELCKNDRYFLIGEKGTGKTAYAVFLANNSYSNTLSRLAFVRETEYKKFLDMKISEKLGISDFTSIWRVILLLMLAEGLVKREDETVLSTREYKSLRRAIEIFYQNAFKPELIYAISFAEHAQEVVSILKNDKPSGRTLRQGSTSNPIALMVVQRALEDALSSLKLKKSHVLFVDGIDIRPSGVPFEVYLECVKGLANAVWILNQDVFSAFRDSIGRLRVVLLLRPDIFDSLGLQNQNTKLRDNSVLLDWRTTYEEHRRSPLFHIADRLLSSQQAVEDVEVGATWDYYFPYKVGGFYAGNRSAFLPFLRYSFYRPRDIVVMLKYLKDVAVRRSMTARFFAREDFASAEFRRAHSEYLLGEVKDHLAFYYSSEDYERFLKFFSSLRGIAKFSFERFQSAYEETRILLEHEGRGIPAFMDSAERFLQFLYELNIICFFDPTADGRREHIRHCFRERSYSNIRPKIRPGVKYAVHQGLRRALNLGQ